MFELLKKWWSFRKDSRVWRFIWEKHTKGFSEDDTWSLDITIAKFVLPRLKYLREIKADYPGSFDNPADWYEIMDKIIFALEKIAADDHHFPDQHTGDRIQEGCKLFGSWFQHLWC